MTPAMRDISNFTGASITLDTAKLDALIAGYNGNKEQVFAKLGFLIEADAKAGEILIDTGACRSSIYTKTRNNNGYSAASMAAQQLRPGVLTEDGPDLQGDEMVQVGASVAYALWVELMLSSGFLVPAVERQAGKLDDPATWKEVFGA